MQHISIATKRITYQGLPAYYPALVFQGDIVNGRTIKEVRVYTEGGALATRATALKYAQIHLNELRERIKRRAKEA